MARRIYKKDCLFTTEEIDEFHAMLYSVNTSSIAPSVPVSWLKGYQNYSSKY
jgi:hypothetical protein|nr:MAG TPA: hypothetical protein [Caudoviricetes sp.]